MTGAGSGASNIINDRVQAEIETGSSVTATSGAVTLSASDNSKVQVFAGGFALSVAGGEGGGTALSLGASVAINNIGNTIETVIAHAPVSGAGGVSLNASESAQIEALTIAGSFSVATGEGGAIGFAGTGAGSGNTIHNTTTSSILNGSIITTGRGASVLVMASDTSGITANAGALAVSVAASEGGGLGGAVGAAAAVNSIANSVEAIVDASKITSGGGVSLNASSDDNIFTIAVGVAGSLAGGEGGGVALSGAGSGSGNTVTNTVEAAIKDGSTVTSVDQGEVRLTATDQSKITAASGSVALGVAGGEGGGAGLAIGVSAASNEIGTASTPNTVEAFIDNSTVTGDGGVNLSATSTARIWVLTVAGSFSGAGGEAGGLAFAGAGAGSGNTVNELIESEINDDSTVTSNSGAVDLVALDDSTITAAAGSVALTIAGGEGGGIGVSFGASVAINNITNTVEAEIGTSTVASASEVLVSASETATILATTVAAAGGVAGGEGGGIAVSGAGAGSSNNIGNQVIALVTCSTVGARNGGGVNVLAGDSANIQAIGIGVAISAAGGEGGGIAAGAGAAAAVNSIGDTVNATVNLSTVTSDGDVDVSANEAAVIFVLTVGLSGALAGGEGGGLALAGAGSGSGNTIGNNVESTIEESKVISNTGAVKVMTSDGSTITAAAGARPRRWLR